MNMPLNPAQTPLWDETYADMGAADPAALENGLVAALAGLGFTRYDPFPGGSGTPFGLKTFVRLFISPESAGWRRIVGALEADHAAAVCIALIQVADQTVIRAWLTETGGTIETYQHGALADSHMADAAPPLPANQRAEPKNALPGELPDELHKLARERGVNPAQAGRLFNRLAGQVMGKLDRQTGGEAGALGGEARALFGGGGKPDPLDSAAGRGLVAALGALGLPDAEPRFAAVRDAYQAARALRRNPKAALLPDERDALRALPGAGEWVAVYAGK
jgi:hypothetical protein